MSNLSIRPAEANERDVPAIYDLLVHMFEEAPLQALNPQKAILEIDRICREEAAWVVEIDGKIVASIGLAEAGHWYSDEPILHTRWLYTLPEHRGVDGAFGLMIEEVRELVKATGMVAWIDVFNPLKTVRRDGRLDAAFRRFSCDPRGARMRLMPPDEKEAA